MSETTPIKWEPGDTVNIEGEPMIIVDISGDGHAVLREADDDEDLKPLISKPTDELQPW